MGVSIFPVSLVHFPHFIILFLQVVLGAMIYIIGSKLLHLDTYEYIISIAKSYLRKKQNVER